MFKIFNGTKLKKTRKFGEAKSKRRYIRGIIVLLVAANLLWIPAVFASSGVVFAGFNVETSSMEPSAWATQGTVNISGSEIIMTDEDGVAMSYINLHDTTNDISDSVDLGGLEIDFSINAYIASEAAEELDTARVLICFRETETGANIATAELLRGTDEAGQYRTLTSDASIPTGTRFIAIELYGTMAGSVNTVKFDALSLKINDNSNPTISEDYDNSWTNQSISVTINAQDDDSGIEGIYSGSDVKVSDTDSYTYTVDANSTHTFYTKDYAGRLSSPLTVNVANIDKTSPIEAPAISVSTDQWSKENVTFTLSDITQPSGQSVDRRQYRIDGGTWTDYTAEETISAEGETLIESRTIDEADNTSDAKSQTIRIDKTTPTITNLAHTAKLEGGADVTVDISDDRSGIAEQKWAEGSQDAAYFSGSGVQFEGGTFNTTTGGIHTVYVRDNAGNEIVDTITINTYPNIDGISSQAMDEDDTKDVVFNVSDVETNNGDLTVTAESSNLSILPNPACVNTNGSVTLSLIPDNNKNGGPITVTVSVTDGSLTQTTQFEVTVNAVNDVPTATDDTEIIVNEDGSVTIDVLANDLDVEGASLTIKDTGNAANGTVDIAPDKKTLTYTPNAHFNGSDSFTYTVFDGTDVSNAATVEVTVNEVNDLPQAHDDIGATDEDTKVTISVLDNDTDADIGTKDGETLTVAAVQDSTHGSANISGNDIEYTPFHDWSGKDTFTYTIEDAAGESSTASISVVVAPVDDAPTFSGLSTEYTINEDSADNEISFHITDIETANDSLMLQAASLNEDMIGSENITIEGLGDALTNVKVLLTPQPDVFGNVDISLQLSDGFNVTTRNITIHIDNTNDAPSAVTDTISFTEDASCMIDMDDLVDNDTDIDQDSLAFGGVLTYPGSGILEEVDSEANTWRYTPVANDDTSHTFTYSVTDGFLSATGTVTLKGIPQNDTPTMSDIGSHDTDEDTVSAPISFTINDIETSSNDLIIIAGSDSPDIVAPENVAITKGAGGNCTLTITPNENGFGIAHITITVSDGKKQTSDSFEFTVNPMPDAPTTNADSVSVAEVGQVVFNPLDNDIDVDGDALTLVSFTQPLYGTVSAEGNTLTYTAVDGHPGNYSFSYTVSDGSHTTTGTVNITVFQVPDIPVISAIENQFINEDESTGTLTFSVTDNDPGDTINVTAWSENPGIVPNGNVTVNHISGSDYTISVIPAADANGRAFITVKAEDSGGYSDTITFFVRIYPVNDEPVAGLTSVTVQEDLTAELDILDHAYDAETPFNLSVIKMTDPEHGYVSGSVGSYIYTPYENYHGSDSFDYTITDGESTVTATLNITVTSVNDAPHPRNNWYELPNNKDAFVDMNILGNDTDVDGDTVYFDSIVTEPKYGDVTDNGDGTWKYIRSTASPEDNGKDSFVYKVRDRADASGDVKYSTATVYIGIDFIPHVDAGNVEITKKEDNEPNSGTPFWINLDISNPNGNAITISCEDSTLGEIIEVDIPNKRLKFMPDANAYGEDTFTYTVRDDVIEPAQTDTASIELTLIPVNDAPEFTQVPGDLTIDEDTPTEELAVAFHDVDHAYDELVFEAWASNNDPDNPVVLDEHIAINRSGGSATIVITPEENQSGSANICLLVSDGIERVFEWFEITVNPINDAPVAPDLTMTLFEDSSDSIIVADVNSDVDGDTVSVSVETQPQHGNASVNPDKTIQYTPIANYNGEDSFKYTLSDGNGGETTGTITVTVEPINDTPELLNLDHYYATNEDTSIEIPFKVHDVDGDTLTVTCVSSNLTLVPNASIVPSGTDEDRKLTITPTANGFGVTTITVSLTDGTETVTQDIELTVNSVNDIPDAKDDTFTVDEDDTVVLNVVNNDVDVETSHLKVIELGECEHGSASYNADGTVTYTPDENYFGQDTFTYIASDENNGTDSATVTVTVTPVNDRPKAADDNAKTDEDASVIIDVLSNDTDLEGDTISIDAITPGGKTQSVVDNGDGTVTYTPKANATGNDTFTYTITDGQSENDKATASVHVEIKPINDPPTAYKNAAYNFDWKIDEDTVGTFVFDIDDVETAAENLIVVIESSDQSLVKDTSIVFSGTGAEKTVSMMPELHVSGSFDLVVSVSDGINSAIKNIPIEILGVNDQPSISAQDLTTPEDTVVNGTAQGSDIETPKASLVFSKRTEAGDGPEHGSVTVNADGSYEYTPNADYNGSDSFVVVVDDGSGESNSTNFAVVNVTVTPSNDAPTANDDTATTSEDTAVNIDVLDNDTDVDDTWGGETLTVVSTSGVDNGTAVINGDNTITFTPADDWNGTETFTYTIKDSGDVQCSANVTITVTPVDDAPQNGDDTFTVTEDIPKALQVLANDDIDAQTNSEPLTVTGIHTQALHGTATVNPDNTIEYEPNLNYTGSDTFKYNMKDENGDAHGHTTTFTVTINVTPVNDDPEISTINDISINEDTQSSGLSFDVTDIEDDDNTLTVTTQSSNTALIPNTSTNIKIVNDGNENRSVIIKPADNQNGSATITLTVHDSEEAVRSETFVVTVTSVNDNPNAQPDIAETDENTPIIIDVMDNDDVDLHIEGDTLDLISVTDADAASYGDFEIITDTDGKEKIRYTPDADWTSTGIEHEVLNYTMTDAAGIVNSSSTVTITINPVNDAPVISAIADQLFNEDDVNGTGVISFTVTDEEDDDSTLATDKATSKELLIPTSNIDLINPGTGSGRTVQVTSALNQNGQADITITVTDADKASSSETFTVTVNPINDPPSNGDDVFTVVEDTPKELDVLANDDVDEITNPDIEDLTVVGIVAQPIHGTVDYAASGGKKILYTPDQDNNDADSFRYRVRDCEGQEAIFTVSITMQPVNDAPDIHCTIPTQYVNEGTATNALSFSVSDVDDVDGELVVSTKSSHEILVLTDDIVITNDGVDGQRTVTVTPNGRWNGTATITLTAKDDEGAHDDGSVATFDVVVAECNDAPDAVDDLNMSTNEDTPKVLDVLGNDKDPDLETNPDTETMTIVSTDTTGVVGTVQITGGGSELSYTPAANWNGTEEFTYTIEDSEGVQDTATVRLKVNAVNDAPSPAIDSATTDEETAILIDVLNNDTDVDKDTSLNNDPFYDPATETVSIKADGFSGVNGTAVVEDSKVKFTPAKDFSGTETFTYTAVDASGATQTAEITVTVNPVNDAPVAVNDSAETDEDNAVSFNVLANDTDVDSGDSKNVVSNTDPSSGSVTVSADGSATYTPVENWNGVATFEYTMQDGDGEQSTATVTVTVKPANDAPVAVNDTANTHEEVAVLIDVLDNDRDVDTNSSLNHPVNETLSIKADGFSGVDNGTVEIESGQVKFTPAKDFSGTEKFTYTMTDAADITDTADVTVTVANGNDAPAAVDDGVETNEDTAVSFNVLNNDTDVDIGDTKEVISNTTPAKGTLLVDADGSADYTPAENWNGVVTFEYTMEDSGGEQSTAEVTITVHAVNDPPVAADDAASTDEEVAVLVDVLNNDTDVDTDTGLNNDVDYDPSSENISIKPGGFSGVDNGTVVIESGKVKFTPAGNWNGTETFKYTVEDAAGAEDTAEIEITVNAVNDPPAARDDSATTSEDTPVNFNVLMNDLDADKMVEGDTFAVVSNTDPAHGTVTVAADGAAEYIPSANWNGTVTFEYTMKDKENEQSSATVTVTVEPANDVPVAMDDTGSTNEDTPVLIDVVANDKDIDLDAALNEDTSGEYLSVKSTSNVLNGTAEIVGNQVRFTPNQDWNGTTTFSYTVKDAQGATDTATVTVMVNGTQDVPVARDDGAVTDEDTPVTIDVLNNDSDADGDTDLNHDTDPSSENLTILSTALVDNGSVEIVGKQLKYTPSANWNGREEFEYTIRDSAGNTASAEVAVVVGYVNDTPSSTVIITPYKGEKHKKGSTVAVTWLESNDTEGDVLTYKLEFFDGNAWKLLMDGLSELRYDHEITDVDIHTNKAKYRVYAYDGETYSEPAVSKEIIIDTRAPQQVSVSAKNNDGSTYTSGEYVNHPVTISVTGGQDLLDISYAYTVNGNQKVTVESGEIIPFDQDGEYRVILYTNDELNNTAEIGEVVVRIDTQSPVIPKISYNTERMTNGNVTVTLNLLPDPGNSGNAVLIMPNGSKQDAADTMTFTAKENGVYNFVLTDNAGNETAFSIEVDWIDRVPPTVTCDYGSYSLGEWTNDDIIAELIYRDGNAGIVQRKYAVTTTRNEPQRWENYVGEMDMPEGEYFIHGMAVDRAGNTAAEVFGPFMLDKTAPKIGVVLEQGDGGFALTIQTKENGSGLATVKLDDGQSLRTTELQEIAVQPGTVTIIARDRAGNESRESIHVPDFESTGDASGEDTPNTPGGGGGDDGPIIDTIAPIVEQPVINYGEKTATVRVKAKDIGSGVVKMRVAGGEWIETDELIMEDVPFGQYEIEVMDKNGNISKHIITVGPRVLAWWLWVLIGLLGGIIIILLFYRNLKITAVRESDDDKQEKVRKWLVLRTKDKDFMRDIDLEDGFEPNMVTVRMSKILTRRMREGKLTVMNGKIQMAIAVVPKDQDGNFEETYRV